nr:precorrin-3B C(17)-methyltransferase [Thermoanaerobacterium sp. RBIITD]
MYEIAEHENKNIDIEIIPGISAFNSSASILGAPIVHDFASLSLSNYLTPWEIIEKRLRLAAQADFVIVLYNPKSKERPDSIRLAQNILLKYKSEDTPVGIVKNASRNGQNITITTLKEINNHEIDMTTTVIIGNEKTYVINGKMITPRGYKL